VAICDYRLLGYALRLRRDHENRRALLCDLPFGHLMIENNYLKQLAYKLFWKQLVQLVKTTSSLPPSAALTRPDCALSCNFRCAKAPRFARRET